MLSGRFLHAQAVEGARIAGASKIIAVDINPAKLALGTSHE